MFRNIRQLSWIGLTLAIGVVSCHFPQSPALAQVNSSSANNEDKTMYRWNFLEPYSYPSSVADRYSSYREYNPLIICETFVEKILPWKCPQPSTSDTANSPQPQNTNSPQNNQPASTSQPPKK